MRLFMYVSVYISCIYLYISARATPELVAQLLSFMPEPIFEQEII